MLTLAALALLADPHTGPTFQDVTDDRARAAYERLSTEDRKEVVDWFTAEVGYAGTFQGQLVEHLLGNVEEDPGLAATPPEVTWFDPEVHAPGQPIPRRPLPEGSAKLERERQRFLRVPSSRECERVWSWDWASGTLRRRAVEDDVDRRFRNGLRGFVPDFDLAHALLVGTLDDGGERTTHRAFAHAYTDRVGTVFGGVTLYDAWNSGANMEMPDVDILGVLHDCLDLRKYTAPIPNSRQDEAYELVGELFVRARRHRTLREALADTYLEGQPFDRNGYGGVLLNLHGKWEEVSSDPSALAGALPAADARDPWLEDLAKRMEDDDYLGKALRRRDQLVADKARVRATLVRVLAEFGALDD